MALPFLTKVLVPCLILVFFFTREVFRLPTFLSSLLGIGTFELEKIPLLFPFLVWPDFSGHRFCQGPFFLYFIRLLTFPLDLSG